MNVFEEHDKEHAEGVDLSSKFPRSQSDLTACPIHGAPTLQITGRKRFGANVLVPDTIEHLQWC